ncbi:uncharacterized protein Dyak_GE28007 [Drosophila yakuba]|uniref:Uncharacterized protein n=1 Tax=Drosophila yakuba TaxID=7245 RepID=A0A0R1E3R6_DROYA|nr:uncharacterized protein Dyak_GE28007 [Drosophila yakuba]
MTGFSNVEVKEIYTPAAAAAAAAAAAQPVKQDYKAKFSDWHCQSSTELPVTPPNSPSTLRAVAFPECVVITLPKR